MDWVSLGAGGIIGFLSSLGVLIVTRWLERCDQRRVSLGWLRVEIERSLDRLRIFQEKEPEWRGPPLLLEINFPPFRDEAYQALIQRLPVSSQDKELLKRAASFYERLDMIEFLRQRFNEGEPGGKPESLDNLMRAIRAAQSEGEDLLKALEKSGIR